MNMQQEDGTEAEKLKRCREFMNLQLRADYQH